MLRLRLLSLRAFSETGVMLDADVAEGAHVEPLIERLLNSPDAAYTHIHFAKRGCYAAKITRSPT